MELNVVFVHGIGDHHAGYSDPWRDALDPHLAAGTRYHEVLWDPVFDELAAGTRGAEVLGVDPREERWIRQELLLMLAARASAVEETEATTRGDTDAIEWSELEGDTRAALNWLFNFNEYIGDFVKYLASSQLRGLVKARMREKLEPHLGGGQPFAVVSHSWGSVVAYDTLLDLVASNPDFKVADLFTLGSPLWLVRRFLDRRDGARPASVGHWVNIHARGDAIGSWLKPGFDVDKDYEVPSVGDSPHGSYFHHDNTQVLRDLIGGYASD